MSQELLATRLLATKLHVPRLRASAVRRPRLTQRIAVTDRPPLTLLSASAGFGKTSLLADWFEGGAGPVAWLALDDGDNDPVVFGSYLVEALGAVSPRLGRAIGPALRSGEPLRTAAQVLVNELAAAEDDLTVVLDDYHAIESGDVHDAIAFLVDHAPRGFGLVVATRADPPFPLARWRAGGDLVEIRAADLRFTIDEVGAYLGETVDLNLTEVDVAALEDRTEGWIAALQLAALSLRGRSDPGEFIRTFAGDDRFVLDYLADEVLDRQSDDTRRFLLQTSVLDRLNGPLCDAVTGGTGGSATLELLERANLFLVPLDDRRRWYRYHHLFADVLRARLLDEPSPPISELHRRASDWFARHDHPAEAIRHACAAQDFARAAELIEVVAPTMRRTRQEATLRQWLESLPTAIYDDRPVLGIALVGARMATGDTTGLDRLLGDAERWHSPGSWQSDSPDRGAAPIVFDADEFAALPAQIAVYRAAQALLAGDSTGTIAHAVRALDLAEPTDHLRRGAAEALTGLAHWSQGDLDEARRRYASAIAHLVDIGHISDVLGCSLALGDIQVARGRLGDAERTYERALALASGHAVLRGTADMEIGLAEVCIERNRLDDAARHLEAATQLGDHAGLPQRPYRSLVAEARLRQYLGDIDHALDLVDAAERVYDTDFSPATRPVAALRARLHLARGDVGSVREWASDRRLHAGGELGYVHEYEYVTLARMLLAEESPSATSTALALLDRLLSAAERGGRAGTSIELLVLIALGREACGDRSAATEALEHALLRAEPEGFLRVFVDAIPALTPVVRSVAPTSIAARHARRILAAAGPVATSTAPQRSGLVDDLSGRELDVLRYLRTDLTGPDIARELHISLNTLRTHTKHIYTKLGATNRREAIRAATEHGL